jgi:hypothetical protein
MVGSLRFSIPRLPKRPRVSRALPNNFEYTETGKQICSFWLETKILKSHFKIHSRFRRQINDLIARRWRQMMARSAEKRLMLRRCRSTRAPAREVRASEQRHFTNCRMIFHFNGGKLAASRRILQLD